jgi:hydroxyacylglutathione hydrolase
MESLSLTELLRKVNAGAQLVDLRSGEEHAAGHVEDALFLGLEGKIEHWGPKLLQGGVSIVALLDDESRSGEVQGRFASVGLSAPEGRLECVKTDLAPRPDLVRRVARLGADELKTALEGGDPPLVLDVREEGEVAAGRIGGSLSVPLSSLRARLADVPKDRALVTVCAGGWRSLVAASVLERNGHEALADLRGGMAAWRAAGLAEEL